MIKIPQEFNGMHFVKAYQNYALYTNGLWNECFQYWDLGITTRQRRGRRTVPFVRYKWDKSKKGVVK